MSDTDTRFPRVTIQFCTQCKWNLRAAYFAQELLQTFSTTLGEISLLPSTGGVFKVDIYTRASSSTSRPPAATNHPSPHVQRTSLWERSTDGGFPETKELKRRVRDVIDPGRGLGHVDRDYPSPKNKEQSSPPESVQAQASTEESSSAAWAGEREESVQRLVAREAAAVVDAAVAGETVEGGKTKTQAPQESSSTEQQDTPLPRPRDIASRAARVSHSPGSDVQQPHQREWGAKDSDRTVPGGGGVGGTKPGTREREEQRVAEEDVRTAPAVKDANMEVQDGERGRGEVEGEGAAGGKRCEDCE
ncbi:Rdx family-domain-containing protein [Coniochaeta sp. 2T2.1]|nr:Rdx family-domain-containing protein [Coniochaeta sp. 2T2.1]